MTYDRSTPSIAEAFATVVLFTLIDGFGRPPEVADRSRQQAEALVMAAQEAATTDSPSFPAAVRLESLDGVYSRALATYQPPTTREGAVLGLQGENDDWAWLITDSLVNSFDVPHRCRVGLHARAVQLVQEVSGGAPSVYLPAAIRQRLSTR